MRGIRTSDRLLIAGQTGKGKTTLARFLAEQVQPLRLIVFDPKDELVFPGVVPARNPAELIACLHQPLVHYVPASFDRDQLEEVCQIVWLTPGPYLWWIDETSEVSSPAYVPEGLRLAVTQGRSKQKMVMALTQRLAEIHPVFRSQSEHIFIFTPAPIELDLKTIAGNIGVEASELRAALNSLHQDEGDFSHLWFVRESGELRRCAPLDTGAIPPAPRDPAEPEGEPGGTPTTTDPAAAESAPCETSDSASAHSSRSA